jgi:glycosyltransferase involved in cell wall biosynthesis
MTGSAPPLSIGMPVYNGARWLSLTFDSLLGQSFGDFELIVSDNASTDGTEEICRQTSARDKRVRYVRQESNIGNDPNYNAVFALARGALFKWSSCNDLCHRDLLARCVDVLSRRPDVALCYGRTRLIDGEGRALSDYDDNLDLQDERPSVRGERLLRQLRLNNAFNGVFRTTMLAPAMPIELYENSDVNLMLSVALAGKFVEVPEYLFFRRMDPEACVAVREHTSTPEEAAKIDPAYSYAGDSMKLRYRIGSFRAVARARIPIGEKLPMFRRLALRAFWERRDLARGLHFDFASVLSRR